MCAYHVPQFIIRQITFRLYSSISGHVKLIICFYWTSKTTQSHLELFYIFFLCRSEQAVCEPVGLWNSQKHLWLISFLFQTEPVCGNDPDILGHVSSSPWLNSLLQSCIVTILKTDISDQMDPTRKINNKWRWNNETIRFPENLMWTVVLHLFSLFFFLFTFNK